MKIETLQEELKKEMTIKGVVHPRYYHSLSVANKAIELIRKHQLSINEEEATIAGILHDCTKLKGEVEQREILKNMNFSSDDDIMTIPNVWHGYTGEWYACHRYGIENPNILNAIRNHVMGREKMTDLEIVILVADFVENTRKGYYFEKARALADQNLIDALKYILEEKINYTKSKGLVIANQTLKTYQYYKVVKNWKK